MVKTELAEVKSNLNKEVVYKESKGRYKLTGCILRKNEKTNECYYTAELLDIISNNSILYCKLSDISKGAANGNL